MSRRRQGRELVLGCLYAHFSTGEDPEAIFRVQAGRVTYDADTLGYAKRLFLKSVAEADVIDRTIRDRATNWDFSRIAILDRLILRMAICELLYFKEIPPKVTMNEAIELAKLFSTERSGQFVNGVLDAVLNDMKVSGELSKAGRGLFEGQPGHHKPRTPAAD